MFTEFYAKDIYLQNTAVISFFLYNTRAFSLPWTFNSFWRDFFDSIFIQFNAM